MIKKGKSKAKSYKFWIIILINSYLYTLINNKLKDHVGHRQKDQNDESALNWFKRTPRLKKNKKFEEYLRKGCGTVPLNIFLWICPCLNLSLSFSSLVHQFRRRHDKRNIYWTLFWTYPSWSCSWCPNWSCNLWLHESKVLK